MKGQDERAETQRGGVIYPRSPSLSVVKLGIKSRSPGALSNALSTTSHCFPSQYIFLMPNNFSLRVYFSPAQSAVLGFVQSSATYIM